MKQHEIYTSSHHQFRMEQQLMYHSCSIMVSSNLDSFDEQFNTMMNTPLRRLARQPPAELVWPVLMPCQPLPSSLFVFVHFLTQNTSSKFQSYSFALYSSQFIIYLNSLLVAQYLDRVSMSLADETLSMFISPCGLANTVLPIFSYLHFLFISLRNLLMNVEVVSQQVKSIDSISEYYLHQGFTLQQKRSSPNTSARRQAASLPEGSIAPYNKSNNLMYLPSFNSAVVPMWDADDLLMRMSIYLSISYFSKSSMLMMVVIILVRLATYLCCSYLTPTN